MPKFMLTGTYSAAAAKGMAANPSDREEAAHKIVNAAGGQVECWYATTGPTDFVMIVEAADVTNVLAGVMAAAGSGTFGRLETQRAFTSTEFTAIQKRAGELTSSYMSAT